MSRDPVAGLLADLRHRDVCLRLRDGGGVHVDAPKGALTANDAQPFEFGLVDISGVDFDCTCGRAGLEGANTKIHRILVTNVPQKQFAACNQDMRLAVSHIEVRHTQR